MKKFLILLLLTIASAKAEIPRDANGWAHLAPNQYVTTSYEKATQIAAFFEDARNTMDSELIRADHALISYDAYVTEGGEAFAIMQYMPDGLIIRIVAKGHGNQKLYLIPTNEHYYQ
jgi:hypothetical protein